MKQKKTSNLCITLFIFVPLLFLSSLAFADYSITLTPGQTDDGHYGKFYRDDHQGEPQITTGGPLSVKFSLDASAQVTLKFVGYDIDLVDEVSIQHIGGVSSTMTPGPNNAHGTAQQVQLGVLDAGEHTVVFTNRRSGWVWGVSELLVNVIETGGGPVGPPEPVDVDIDILLAELNCNPGDVIKATDTGQWVCASLPEVEEQCDPEFVHLWRQVNSAISNPTDFDTPAVQGEYCEVTKMMNGSSVNFRVVSQFTDFDAIGVIVNPVGAPSVSAYFRRFSVDDFGTDVPTIPLNACAALIGCRPGSIEQPD